jgi:hypothetical protein
MKRVVIVLCVVGILLGTFITFSASARSPSLDDVRAKYERQLIAIKGVSGVASDTATNQIVVYTETQNVCANVPKELDGVQVQCEVIGRIEALQPAAAAEPNAVPTATRYSRTGVDRPVFGGISVMTSAYPTAAGTLGLVIGGNQILSCTHVLALNSNQNPVPIGTPVWQPGGYDGGSAADAIGTLTKYIPIVFGPSGTNTADAATATLLPSVTRNVGQVLNAANNGFVSISGVYTGALSTGSSVSKSGRTSGVTTNQVLSTNATVLVYYNSTAYAVFTNQLLVRQPFLQSGDSGSAVYKNGEFVGLGFAASNTVAVVCQAQYIESGLGITGNQI